jgi:hypothetical protein
MKQNLRFRLGFGSDWAVKSLTWEATPSATKFFKRAYKIGHHCRLIKNLGLILVKEKMF